MKSLPLPPGGCFTGPLHRYAVRAFFEDTDLSGVVYHANYLRWFERARSDLMRLLGLNQRAAYEAGEGAYAVADLTIRYAAPARLDDVVMIETLPEEVRAASCRLHQRALRDGILLAEARVRVGLCRPRWPPPPATRCLAGGVCDRRQCAPRRPAFRTSMNLHSLLSGPANGAAHLNPINLFLDADIVVQLIMAGLLLASIWVWTIVISFSLRMGRLRRQSLSYERAFWQASDLDAFQAPYAKSELPSAQVVSAAMAEWRRSHAGKKVDRERRASGWPR